MGNGHGHGHHHHGAVDAERLKHEKEQADHDAIKKKAQEADANRPEGCGPQVPDASIKSRASGNVYNKAAFTSVANDEYGLGHGK